MKKERVILSIIAIAVGLLFAGIAFNLYQGTKDIPSIKKTITISTPSPAPAEEKLLTVNEPENEKVYTTKVVNISGKTNPNATVVVLTDSDQQVLKPTANGSFSTTVNIGDDQNVLEITTILPNGERKTVRKTVSYSTEEF